MQLARTPQLLLYDRLENQQRQQHKAAHMPQRTVSIRRCLVGGPAEGRVAPSVPPLGPAVQPSLNKHNASPAATPLAASLLGAAAVAAAAAPLLQSVLSCSREGSAPVLALRGWALCLQQQQQLWTHPWLVLEGPRHSLRGGLARGECIRSSKHEPSWKGCSGAVVPAARHSAPVARPTLPLDRHLRLHTVQPIPPEDITVGVPTLLHGIG